MTDSGWIVMTDKEIYFSGQDKAFRVPFTKILSTHVDDGLITVLKDSQTAKPILLAPHDPSFVHDVLQRLLDRNF